MQHHVVVRHVRRADPDVVAGLGAARRVGGDVGASSDGVEEPGADR